MFNIPKDSNYLRYNITIARINRMGILESKNKKRVRKTKIQKLILESVLTVGVLSAALLAPNVIGAMYKLGIMPKKRQGEYVSSSAAKMVRKGLMRFNGKFYEPTYKGQELLKLWNLDNYLIRKPGRWDKKWRIIIYDISEKKRRERMQIFSIFTQAGFYHLQNSVWVYPYDCEDIISLLKTDFGVGKNVLYIIADEIENDKYLRAFFEL